MRLAIYFLVLLKLSCTSNEYGEKILKESLQRKYLAAHNTFRDKGDLDHLSWDKELEQKAYSRAKELSKDCGSTGSIEGDGIYQSWGTLIKTPRAIITSWVAEGKGTYKKIMSDRTYAVGCGFDICKDPKSYSTSIIHICYYRQKPFWDRLVS